MLFGYFHQLLCCPGKIRFDKIETAERIKPVRIKPRRDDDQIRAKTILREATTPLPSPP